MRNSIRKLSTDIWMRLLIVVAALVGFYFTYQKYSHFGGDTNDLTVYSYAFAQTLKGRFFPLYYVPGHLLGNHLNFIILATLPVYAIFQSFCTLLFLQSVIIAIPHGRSTVWRKKCGKMNSQRWRLVECFFCFLQLFRSM